MKVYCLFAYNHFDDEVTLYDIFLTKEIAEQSLKSLQDEERNFSFRIEEKEVKSSPYAEQ